MSLALDLVAALAHLCDRSGATGLELRWDCPHDTDDQGHDCPDVRWDASTTWKGARLIVDGMSSPTTAALALAERLLDGATCRCGQPVSLSDAPGCRWRLHSDKWTPSCDAASHDSNERKPTVDDLQRAAYRQPMASADKPFPAELTRRHGRASVGLTANY